MFNELPNQSFLDILKENPLFQALPDGLKQQYIDAGLDNAVDLCKDLCVQANRFLSRGDKNGAIKALTLAEELAELVNDPEKASQIIAWLGLLDYNDAEIVREVIEMIREEIQQTHEFQSFRKKILKQND